MFVLRQRGFQGVLLTSHKKTHSECILIVKNLASFYESMTIGQTQSIKGRLIQLLARQMGFNLTYLTNQGVLLKSQRMQRLNGSLLFVAFEQ